MADNVQVTAGAGTIIATDQVGADHYQRVKLTDGTADSATVIAADEGAVDNALRVVPANDLTDGTYIGDIKFGESLPAGTAAIGKLAANTGVDIGDVDVTSVVPGTGATNLGKAEDAAHSTGDVGVMILTVRQDAVAALAGADGDYQPLSTTANGRLRVKTQADVTHDGVASATGSQILAAYDSTKPTAVADGDAVRVLADSYGRLLQGVEPEWFQAVADSADVTAEGNVVKAATASKKICITSFIISSDVEGWIKLQDEDSNALTGKFWLKAGGGVSWTAGPGAPIILNVANKALEVIAEAAGDVSVMVVGYLIPG